MLILNKTDMQWTCPYCKHENTASMESLDYEPVMCANCDKTSEVWFELQPVNVIIKGVD